VGSEVIEGSSPTALQIHPPGHGTLRVNVAGVEVLGTVVEDPSQGAGGHELLRPQGGGHEAVVEGHLVRDGMVFECCHDLHRLGGTEAKGLVAVDRLAGAESLHHEAGVGVVRGADMDDPDVFPGKDLRRVIGGEVETPVLLRRVSGRPAGGAYAHQSGAQRDRLVVVPHRLVGVGVYLADEAVTDDSDAVRVHASPRLSTSRESRHILWGLVSGRPEVGASVAP